MLRDAATMGRYGILVTLILGSLSARLAMAEPAEAVAEAKAEYDRAAKYSKAGEFGAALPHFQQAYELSGHRPSSILALAQCERELKMYDEALIHYREYLATNPGPKEAARVQGTIELLLELKRREQPQPAAEQPEGSAQAKTPEVPLNTPESVKPSLSPPPSPALEVAPKPDASGISPAPASAVNVQPPPEEPSSVISSPYLWVGVGLAAVAGGVVLALALPRSADLYGGNTGIVLRK